MSDDTTLYTYMSADLTADQLESLAVDGAKIQCGDEGEWMVEWPDVQVAIFPMADVEARADHLGSFRDFVLRTNGGKEDEGIADILSAIDEVRNVVGCCVTPASDSEFKAKSLIVSLAVTLDAFFFYEGNLYTPYGELWYGQMGAGSYAELSDLTVRMPAGPEVELTDRMKERTSRVQQTLRSRQVPPFDGHIRWIKDDDEVALRSPQEVARRVLAMHAVVCLARGRDADEVVADLEAADVMDSLSPNEIAFLKAPSSDDHHRMPFIWRLEALWQLMWALNHVDDFVWPGEMCDVDGLHKLIFSVSEDDPKQFIQQASLRPKAEILDMTETIVRIHWAIRQEMVNSKPIPNDLDWANSSDLVDVHESPSPGVVAERHYALNWLTQFTPASWDDVDTPT